MTNAINTINGQEIIYNVSFVFELSSGGFKRFSGDYAVKDSTTAISKAKDDFFATNNQDGRILIIRYRKYKKERGCLK